MVMVRTAEEGRTQRFEALPTEATIPGPEQRQQMAGHILIILIVIIASIIIIIIAAAVGVAMRLMFCACFL